MFSLRQVEICTISLQKPFLPHLRQSLFPKTFHRHVLKLLNCRHHHCVFTIPEQLRLFFLKDRSLLSDLFHSVRDIILRLFSKMNRSENFTSGFIAVLHSFGRDLKWNPHIHVLVSEGGAGNKTPWRKVSHFNFNFLHFAFRTALLDRLAARLGPSFTPIKSLIYKLCPKG